MEIFFLNYFDVINSQTEGLQSSLSEISTRFLQCLHVLLLANCNFEDARYVHDITGKYYIKLKPCKRRPKRTNMVPEREQGAC